MRAGLLRATAVVALAAAGALPGAALAQDEDRLAALEREIMRLTEEVRDLRAAQQAQAAQVAARPAPAAAPVQVASAPVAAELVREPPRPGPVGQPFYPPIPEGRNSAPIATGTDTFRLTMTGWINPAINMTDDGESNDVFFVGNENASTRMRFSGISPAMGGTYAMANFEFEFLSNSTLGVSQMNPNGAVFSPLSNKVPDQDIRRRHIEVGFANDGLGTVWLGHGWTASDNTTEINMGGAFDATWASQHFAFGGMLFTDPRTGGYARRPAGSEALPNILSSTPSDISIVNVFSVADSLDGLSRRDRIRYDSPVLEGFQLSGSAGNGFWDAALRYNGSTDWASFRAAVAYYDDTTVGAWGDYTGYGGSAAILFNGGPDAWWTGLNFSASAAKREYDDYENEPLFLYGSVGYRTRLVDWGDTSFGLSYFNYDEFALKNEDARMYGGGVVQHFDRFGATAYMSLHNVELDSPEIDTNDLTVLQMGARVRF